MSYQLSNPRSGESSRDCIVALFVACVTLTIASVVTLVVASAAVADTASATHLAVVFAVVYVGRFAAVFVVPRCWTRHVCRMVLYIHCFRIRLYIHF
jgi:hypothetical protein